MVLTWQHVVIVCVGLACAAVVIVLGHGQTLLQVLTALGALSGAIGTLGLPKAVK